jgi:UDP-N-acetylmuramate--alanine ligase
MKNVYFIGVGGIGMSALARYYNIKGYKVSGYDKTPSVLTAQLEKEGIEVHYEDRPDLVPASVEDTLVIWTPAIHELKELDLVREKGYRVVKRAFALGEVAKGKRCLAVAGTHGKTTTSTLTAHIFRESGEGCTAFLGGVSRNYGTNLLVSDNDVIVAEADEFDRSFHCLFPEIAVITAIDADHLDIYGDYAHVLEAFKIFASQVSGAVIAKKGVPLSAEDTPAQFLTYHYNDPEADFHAENIRTDDCGHFIYDLRHPGGLLEGVRVGTPGRVNAENSVAAAAIALTYGLDPEAVKHAVGTFEGVKRRLEIHVNKPGVAYVDDYAHHPAELAAAIASLRDIFPGRKITAVFQPHLYTRTRDFAPEFAKSLSAVDKLILLPIYPAREEPIPGVTSDIILNDVTAPERVLVEKEKLMEYLEKEPVDVLVTFGAGNIDRFIGPIAELLGKR